MTVSAALQRIATTCALACALSGGTAVAWAQATPRSPEVDTSALDGELLFQLLVAEMELRSGDFNAGYAKLLDAARRTRSDELFERAANLALARDTPDQALGVVRNWRQARPNSMEALQYEMQILAMRARVSEIAEPLSTFISRTPATERGGAISGTAGLINRLPANAASAQMIESVLKPYTGTPPTRTPALVATARAWMRAGDPMRAQSLAQTAALADPTAIGPALLGLELMDKPIQVGSAEALVTSYLAQPTAAPAVRMAYVQTLTKANRYSDALRELRRATDAAPAESRGWLARGALEVELRRASDAEQSLQKFLDLQGSAPTVAADGDDDSGANRAAQRTQALLLLSQAAQMRKDLPAAHRWLDQIGPVNGSLEVAMRRALIWAAEGRLREARVLIAGLPESEEVTRKAKTMADSQVLRESKHWAEALALLDGASASAPDDTDLIYERAMLAEKLERHDDVERLLRRVIALKPKHHHAHNALGYALADRNVRLPEARALIGEALKLAPTDPFITDSMGWVEFRLGNLEAALAHLKRAYAQRPDTEIAAHLGEVLWVAGQRDEAQRIWREAREREADNDVLRETLRRLQIRL